MPGMTIAQRTAMKRKAVHAACRELGMDDDTRRAMMERIAGVRSTKDLTLASADLVLDHLKQTGAGLGKRNVGRHRGAPSTLDHEPYLQKIEALLADMQLPWRYAERTAENITGGKPGGIQRLAWVRDGRHLRATVAALMVEKKKRLAKAWDELDARLAAQNLNRNWCLEQARQMERLADPWPWRECLETLRMIKEHLG